ncbi:hypothetical protein [Pseudoclavibacter sp. VKM Ac-2888]|uniref:hypothetical protein n=1 Tax=Pseudoclavibacter sp. VKM Ac-2888 TaxID=2783830 RepID=UPI00188C58C9|nr:hypothetical protein [Pseudoclavibacter sp. VKM Ac-2888]MBF4549685.1 hypothetical protein [Pseudoclavibacter sp. VKM Ac-2888]
MRVLAEKPWVVHLIFAFAIAIEYAVVTRLAPEAFDGWIAPELSETRLAVQMGALGAAALLSGFAGVVSVFGLTAGSLTFVRFRLKAGVPLSSNWTAVVSAGMLAMLVAGAAAVIDAVWDAKIATYLMQYCALLLIENGVRSIWLMRKLVRITTVSDRKSLSDSEG